MSQSRILVVDDQPINVQLLRRKLEREGIEVLTAENGLNALEIVRTQKPDLILLDVMMPDMDGIEVCERLQAEEESKSIPVIFITARSSKEGKLEGLGVGAVDYITKPIDLDETLARVQTQLRFVKVNRELVDLQRRLSEARRAATIGAVTQGIAHNLNNLLGVVIGYLDLVKAYYDKPELVKKNAGHVEEAVQRIAAIIKQLSSVVEKTRLPLIRAQLSVLLENGIRRYQEENNIDQPVTVEDTLGDLVLDTHFEVFEEVLSKVLINAWEAYGDRPPAARQIWIRTEIREDPELGRQLLVKVEDAGNGIDPEIRDHAFEPFVSSKQTVGVGMGLTVARHALRNLEGEVDLQDRPGGGTIAVLRHPLDRKKKRLTES